MLCAMCEDVAVARCDIRGPLCREDFEDECEGVADHQDCLRFA